MKCRQCIYVQSSEFEFKGQMYNCSSCKLTHLVVNPDEPRDCDYFNADLSVKDICYNCEYYGGGGDWGLFCFHKGMYHHLGKFNDPPCEYYIRRGKRCGQNSNDL